MQAQITTATTAKAARKAANKPAKAAPKAAPAPTLTAQVQAAQLAAPRPFAGYATPKGGAQLPRNCPPVLGLGAKVPRLGTAHTQQAWGTVQAVLQQHKGKAPAQAVLAALAALNHSSFFGYALRSGWLAAA